MLTFSTTSATAEFCSLGMLAPLMISMNPNCTSLSFLLFSRLDSLDLERSFGVLPPGADCPLSRRDLRGDVDLPLRDAVSSSAGDGAISISGEMGAEGVSSLSALVLDRVRGEPVGVVILLDPGHGTNVAARLKNETECYDHGHDNNSR